MANGFKVRFWNDLWCGDKALKEAFPDLYGVKDAFLVAHLEFFDDSNKWNVSFARVAYD